MILEIAWAVFILSFAFTVCRIAWKLFPAINARLTPPKEIDITPEAFKEMQDRLESLEGSLTAIKLATNIGA